MSTRKNTTAVLKKLRKLMVDTNIVTQPLSGYLIPSRDAHNSEFTAASDERRGFISGFNGSFGYALITNLEAVMWTDALNYIQASEQMDMNNWSLMKLGEAGHPALSEWINQELVTGSIIGVDPRLITYDQACKLADDLDVCENKLLPVTENLVDLIWDYKPQHSMAPVKQVFLHFSGKSTAEKLADIRKELQKEEVGYLVVSDLEEIAWLLNWRGSDIPYKSVFFSFVIIGQKSFDVFIENSEMTCFMKCSISDQERTVKFHQYEDVYSQLYKLAAMNPMDNFWISPLSSYFLVSCIIPEHQRHLKLTPIASMKATKNPIEIKGMQDAHVRDGAAMCQLFGWLEKALSEGEVVTEAKASRKLEEFRSKLFSYLRPGFPTIIRSGDSITKESSKLSANELIMIDCGALYMDGFTDISRTLHFGTPDQEQKEHFANALSSHVELVSAVFPNKSIGNGNPGSFERQSQWENRVDIWRGTGHGIGYYQYVQDPEENPSQTLFPDYFSILEENMFISTEPGHYEEAPFGIRIENIVGVVQAHPRCEFGNLGYLTFEDVTVVPFQQNMIDSKLLSPAEVMYVNNYHSFCREKVGNYMKLIGIPETDRGYKWLYKETQTIMQ